MRGLELLDSESRTGALPESPLVLPDPAMEVVVEPERIELTPTTKPDGALRGVRLRLHGQERGSYPLGGGRTACLFYDASEKLFARVTSVHTMDIHWYTVENLS